MADIVELSDDIISAWKINYGLDTRGPADAARWWCENMDNKAPAGAVAALGFALVWIERLRAELAAEKSEVFRVQCEYSALHHKWAELLYERDALLVHGPQVQRGENDDGSPWISTMREAWEDAIQAAASEARSADALRAEHDAGPWIASDDGRTISSDDFTFDVLLRVTGDFADDGQRKRYSDNLAAKLNEPNAAIDAAMASPSPPVHVSP
jgi:uncharacterized protein YciI